MRIILVGPGRAGGSLAVAASMAGHDVVGVFVRRRADRDVAHHLLLPTKLIGDPMPEADLLIASVRDDVIHSTARTLSQGDVPVPRAIHLSGLAPTSALDPLRRTGLEVGCFHPLQTFPDWRTGASTLKGSYVGITADDPLSVLLEGFAGSLGCRPFRVAEGIKPLYHAAASAASNYVSTVLALAEDLFTKAGVEPRVALPLVEQAVANAFDLGAARSVTGPVARGDTGTLRRQLEAVDLHAPLVSEAFRAFARATAGLTGTSKLMEDLLA